MLNVIERYIFRRAFFIFLTALAWTLAIVWTTQVLAQIDLVTTNGQSIAAFDEASGNPPDALCAERVGDLSQRDERVRPCKS